MIRVSQMTTMSSFNPSSSVCEIEEEEEEEERCSATDNELFKIDTGAGGRVPAAAMTAIKEESIEDVVYVAVGAKADEESSMDALLWTLNQYSITNTAASSSTPLVFLIHVFPQLRYIPTPLGKIPVSQVDPDQKDKYIIQEGSKRREFLQKFLDACSSSKVNVDTILIESDTVGKALLDLIPILNIRKLVLGTTKSKLINRRLRLRSKKGSGGIADEVVQNAPDFCEVKLICQGKELDLDFVNRSPSPRLTNNYVHTPNSPPAPPQSNGDDDYFGCKCFRPKAIS
ncbi:U-box domain-containing protein 36 isoform X2 [Diospyros lotus]|uniref:U-box domain-containing protein 36 isoform X2 n=1 Tax=Diospyros lotus TaxID=55363 RepID=UPI002259175E|nr:U-box domain-containing protein 36 isoform X2 [Diospyros lotus]